MLFWCIIAPLIRWPNSLCHYKGYEDIFSVVENEKNEGLGKARNIGIDQARGEYFIFLDGDDWFETEKLIELINKLKEKKTDIVFYDYQRAWDTGWKKRNQLGHLLYEHDASGVSERNRILSVFCIACNKAYKRSFVDRVGIRFPVGYYEDVPWTYTLLLKAESIYVTDLVLLNYRQREGSILKSTDNRHLILTDRYKSLLSVFSENPHLVEKYGETMVELVRAHLFSRPVWPRLPKKIRKKYLKKSSEVLDEWRKEIGINKIDNTLKVARLGIPFLYVIGKNIRPQKERIKIKLKNILYGVYKNIFCKLPIVNTRVYVEAYWGRKFDGNPIDLGHAIKDKKNYQVFVGINKSESIPKEFDFNVVRLGTLKYWYIVATSRYFISDANLGNNVIKRKKAVHVQTKHGTPLKHMGIENRGKPNHKINWAAFAKRCRRWDYVISSNPYSSKIWRQSFPYDYKVIEMGYPRNDILFNYKEKDIERIKEKLGIPLHKKIALYAPTFKDYDIGNISSKEIQLDSYQAALGDEYVLLVRSHQMSDRLNINGFEDKNSLLVHDVSDYTSTSELLLISDILITDYSSIMFDYACLKRPIILFMYDYDLYLKGRGVYFDIRMSPPGCIAYTSSELIELLESNSYASSEANDLLTKFNKEFCPWDDGNSVERIINEILD